MADAGPATGTTDRRGRGAGGLLSSLGSKLRTRTLASHKEGSSHNVSVADKVRHTRDRTEKPERRERDRDHHRERKSSVRGKDRDKDHKKEKKSKHSKVKSDDDSDRPAK